MAAKVLFLALALFCAASAAPEARENRIAGGTPVTVQEFPYVAAVVYFYPRPAIYIQRCVGAIVSSWHVLCTAYCFSSLSQYSVSVLWATASGGYDEMKVYLHFFGNKLGAELQNVFVRAGSTNSLSGGLLVTVRDVVLHPDYVSNPRVNDLAVMILSSPLPISSTINALYLPPQGFNIADDTTFRVVSWGFEWQGGPQLDTLRSINLEKVNLGTCASAFADVANVAITDSALCAARAGGYGTCFGDSGAPMVLGNVVVGISSVYHECNTDTYPDVFTRVDRFTNWIIAVAQSAEVRSGEVPVRIADM